MTTKTPRKSVPLTPRARTAFEQLVQRDRPAPALERSESALLADALERGLLALADEDAASGYAEYAEWARTDPEEVEVRTALRARRGRRVPEDAIQ